MKKVFISAVLSLSMVFGAGSVYGLGYNNPIENQFFIDNMEEYREKTVTIYINNGEFEFVGGTGWLLEGGFVVTNHHVINRIDTPVVSINVGFYNPNKAKGMIVSDVNVVASDEVEDIALLQIRDKALIETEGAKFFELSSGRPQPGDPLLSLANLPTSMEPYYDTSEGTFKYDLVTRWDMHDGRQETVISYAMDLESRPGNSGGPIIDKYGRIAGMMRGYKTDSSHMIGLAVPLHPIQRFLDQFYSGPMKPINGTVVEVVKKGEEAGGES